MRVIIFILLILLSKAGFGQTKSRQKLIPLKKVCFWENKERKVIDTLKNKIAIVHLQNENYIITIEGKKYLACNLPDRVNKKFVLTGVVYNGDNDKLIAIPLKIIKAYYW